MGKVLKRHLKSNKGSAYIETLVCLMTLLIAGVILFCACSAMMDKMWLDEKISDISKLINASGTTKSEAITALEEAVKAKFGGGTFTYVTNYLNNDSVAAKVQLGEKVVICYDNPQYTAFRVGEFGVETTIHLEKTAISDVYYKPSAADYVD